MRLRELDEFLLEEAKTNKAILNQGEDCPNLRAFLAVFPEMAEIWTSGKTYSFRDGKPVIAEYDRLWWRLTNCLDRWRYYYR